MKGKTDEISNVSKKRRRILTAIEAGESGNFSHSWSYSSIYTTIASSCSGAEEYDDFGEPDEGHCRIRPWPVFLPPVIRSQRRLVHLFLGQTLRAGSYLAKIPKMNTIQRRAEEQHACRFGAQVVYRS